MGETLVLIGASCQRPCGFPAYLLWERTRREQSGLKNCRFCSEVGDSCILGCRCPEPVSAGRRHRFLTLLVAASMQTAWGPSMDPANSCAPPTAATGSAVSGCPPHRWSIGLYTVSIGLLMAMSGRKCPPPALRSRCGHCCPVPIQAIHFVGCPVGECDGYHGLLGNTQFMQQVRDMLRQDVRLA